MTKQLKPPGTYGLSVANLDTSARSVDWPHLRESGYGSFGESPYEVFLPSPTFRDVEEHASDLIAEYATAAERRKAKRSPDSGLSPGALMDEWEQSDAQREWRDGFEPMMNYVWPVSLAYQVSPVTAADLIAEFAPVCTLIRFEDEDESNEYGLALSGGGMNLSDHIATAYLCCGCVPPTRLLTGLAGVIDAWKVKRTAKAFRQAYRRAREWHSQQIADLRREAARVFATQQKGGAQS